jgi:hypothetical protein
MEVQDGQSHWEMRGREGLDKLERQMENRMSSVEIEGCSLPFSDSRFLGDRSIPGECEEDQEFPPSGQFSEYCSHKL